MARKQLLLAARETETDEAEPQKRQGGGLGTCVAVNVITPETSKLSGPCP